MPGNRRRKPVLDPKYCQDRAESRSMLLANNGSKWDDHLIAACDSGSERITGENVVEKIIITITYHQDPYR